MNTGSLACPQCDATLRESRACGCGLDSTLLFAVKNTADGLAENAAKLAADGEWQPAAEAASESLRMVSRDNDLAAFIFLFARLAGARGGPDTVISPRADALPDQLRPYAAPVVDAVNGLRALGLRESVDEQSLREGLETIHSEWPEIGWIAETPAQSEVRGGHASGWGIHRRIASAAAAFVLGAGLVGGAWLLSRTGGEEAVRFPAAASERPAAVDGRVRDLEQRLRDSEIEARIAGARAETLEAYVSQDWSRLAQSIESLQSRPGGTGIMKVIPHANARTIYLAGLQASRKGRFDEAAPLLRAALALAPTNAYFRDDALYYEARALQRLGRYDEALAVFGRLMHEMSSSVYADDSARFYEEIGEGGPDGG